MTPPQPLVRYTFDEQQDPVANHGSLGSGAQGDITGMTQFVASTAGFALRFDALGAVQAGGSESMFDVADDDFAVSARVRVSTLPGSGGTVVSKCDNNGRGYRLSVDSLSGAAEFDVKGSQTTSASSATSVRDGEWHDLLAVRQGASVLLYVDGVLDAQVAVNTGGSTDNSKPLRVGNPSSGSPALTSLRVEVDEFALFDVAVTPVEAGGGTDCNHNGIDDAVELASGSASDCDGNGTLDVCEGGSGASDCNQNGICDEQELAQELAPDVDGNGQPDDCQHWWELPYGIDRMIVFGDSLSDTGNVYALTQGQRPQSPPNYAGRFSDGRVWCEYLAGHLGLAPAQVLNLSFGGAASGNTNSLDHLYPDLLPGLADEVDAYELLVQAGQAPTSSTLFAVWIGANDFNAAQYAGSGLQLDTLVHGAMDNIEMALRRLAQLGARKVLVPNLPDLGATPLVRSNLDPELPASARTATIGFNANLAALLAQLEDELAVDFVLFDAFAFYDELLSQPGDFGFTDVANPCLDQVTNVPCAAPSTRMFWDELHPTTVAHRWIGRRAQQAVLSGGEDLSRACRGYNCPTGSIAFTSPVSGAFTQTSSIALAGVVTTSGRRVAAAQLDVNGVAVPMADDGAFVASVPVDQSRIDQPIVATLRVGSMVLDRERLVVFHGPALDTGATVADAVVARVSTSGIGALTDELNGQLLAHGALDIQGHLLSHGWIASNFSGEFQYTVAPVAAGFLCSSIDIVPTNGRLFVRVNLHDLWIDYYVHSWFDTLPDPAIDCNGRVTASRFSVFTEFAFSPTGGPAGEIAVHQTAPLGFDLFSFDHSGSCATYEEIIDALPWINFSIEQRIRDAIQDKLDGLTQQHVLENELERIVREIKVSEPLSAGLGVQVLGDIADIDIDADDVRVDFDVRTAPPSPVAGSTYAVPMQSLPDNTLNPVNGQPTEFKLSLALRTLNQLFLAKSADLTQPIHVDELDFGAGDQPLTSGVLSALIPELAQLGSAIPMEIRVRPTLPPMVLGADAAAGLLSDLYLGQVLIEFVPTAGVHNGTSMLTFAVDLRGDVELGFDANQGQLTAGLRTHAGSVQGTLVLNRIGADEHVLALLFDSIEAKLIGELSQRSASFPLPALSDVGVDLTHFQSESGYVTCVVDFDSQFARPDLIVEYVDVPVAIDITSPFTISGRVKNVGSQTAYGSVWLGASLSLDNTFMNGNDMGLGPQLNFSLGNGLSPGESKSFTMQLNGAQGATLANQTLFVLADVPFLPGGTGNLCERSEGNNFTGAPVLATFPDAYVASITLPSNVVGGIGPRPYTVRVGRNAVGPDHLWVPVTVTIGCPVVTWNTVMVDVPIGAEIDVDVFVPTPASFGSAGQSNQFCLKACTNLQFDSNWSNNCVSSTVSVAVPWWDLRYEIVNAPSSATHCYTTHWAVRVTNVGNVYSPNVCSITGIGLNSGAGNWNWNLGIFNFTTPNIAPGGSWTYYVNNYFVACGAAQQTQYIKAEVHYSAGCFDNYGAGNYAQKSIQIH